QAARRPFLNEEPALLRKDHFLGLRTIAQLKQVVNPADGVVGAPPRGNGPESGQRVGGGPPSQDYVRSGCPAEADEGFLAAQRLAGNIQTWPPAPDQLQLAQQGRE